MRALKPYKVRPASDDLPDAWETGTQNHECMAGVMAAVDYIAEIGRRANSNVTKSAIRGAANALTLREALKAAYIEIHRHERQLTETLIAGLLAIPGVTVYGITDATRLDQRVGTISIRINGHTPHEIATRLGEQGLFTWDGNFYALDLTERLGVEGQGGLLRIGIVHYNSAEEIERLLAALQKL
jgi:selenocysteine lyase/cysteine desulfurase